MKSDLFILNLVHTKVYVKVLIVVDEITVNR